MHCAFYTLCPTHLQHRLDSIPQHHLSLIFLTGENKHPLRFPFLVPAFFSPSFSPSRCLFYITFQSPINFPPSLSAAHGRGGFVFLDLRSQRKSIARLEISFGRNSNTQLKVLNLIKWAEWFRYAWNPGVLSSLRYSWAYSVCSAHCAGSRGHK